MKLSINEAKLTGLWVRNCATIHQVLILKLAFEPEKFPGLSRNEHQTRFSHESWENRTMIYAALKGYKRLSMKIFNKLKLILIKIC